MKLKGNISKSLVKSQIINEDKEGHSLNMVIRKKIDDGKMITLINPTKLNNCHNYTLIDSNIEKIEILKKIFYTNVIKNKKNHMINAIIKEKIDNQITDTINNPTKFNNYTFNELNIGKKQTLKKFVYPDIIHKEVGKCIKPNLDNKKFIQPDIIENKVKKFNKPDIDKKEFVYPEIMENKVKKCNKPIIDKKEFVNLDIIDNKIKKYYKPNLDIKKIVYPDIIENKVKNCNKPNLDRKKLIHPNVIKKKIKKCNKPNIDKKEFIYPEIIDNEVKKCNKPNSDKKEFVYPDIIDNEVKKCNKPKDKKEFVYPVIMDNNVKKYNKPNSVIKKIIYPNIIENKVKKCNKPNLDKTLLKKIFENFEDVYNIKDIEEYNFRNKPKPETNENKNFLNKFFSNITHYLDEDALKYYNQKYDNIAKEKKSNLNIYFDPNQEDEKENKINLLLKLLKDKEKENENSYTSKSKKEKETLDMINKIIKKEKKDSHKENMKFIINKEDENQLNPNYDDINKNISQKLENYLKNIFSSTSSEKEKAKQPLSVYLNGNISINLLTGNTNPQIVTKNIYNTDSFNKNKSITYDSRSKDDENNEISFMEKSSKKDNLSKESSKRKIDNKVKKINKIKGLLSKSKKLENKIASDNSNEVSDIIKENDKINIEIEKNNIKNLLEESRLDDSIEKKIYDKGENIDHSNRTDSSNFLDSNNSKNFGLSEKNIKNLLEDEELGNFFQKKIELANKNKINYLNRLHNHDAKKFKLDGKSSYFNMEINKLLVNKMKKDYLQYEKDPNSNLKNIKNPTQNLFLNKNREDDYSIKFTNSEN